MPNLHTPTPWLILECHRNPDCLEWVIYTRRPVTESCRENPRIAVYDEMGGSGSDRSEGRANAILGASAPELLDSLVELLDWCRTHTSPLQPNSPHALLVKATAAIAKATTP